MYCLCIVEVFSFLVCCMAVDWCCSHDVHKETYDGSGKDEVLGDATSPLDVVADKV